MDTSELTRPLNAEDLELMNSVSWDGFIIFVAGLSEEAFEVYCDSATRDEIATNLFKAVTFAVARPYVDEALWARVHIAIDVLRARALPGAGGKLSGETLAAIRAKHLPEQG